MLLSGLEKKYVIAAILSPIAMIGEVFMEVLIPLVMSKIIDVGIANTDVAYTTKVGLLMIGCALLSLTCGVLSGRFAAVAALGFARNLRLKLFSSVQNFTFGDVDRFSTASLVTRLTTDVTNTQNTFMMVVRTCVRSPVMLVSAAVMSFYINPKLASIFLVIIPLLAVLLCLIGVNAFGRFKSMFKKYDAMNGEVQENLNAIRVVKAFVRGKYENEEFQKAAEAVQKAQVKAEKIVILNMPLMQIVMYICIILILWFGGNFIISGSMQTGQLISFITYSNQILMSLMMLSMIFISIVISKASISRIVEVLSVKPTIVSPENPVSTEKNAAKVPSIQFENVSFSYDNRADNLVLENINLEIASGQTVGIIGGTGSSKTTLVQLIPRLYDVLSGAVLVDGVDVRKQNLETLRQKVAMVLQNNVLFTGTIRENIKWGNPDATDAEIEAVCKAACADDFIKSFVQGYDTVLGQGGVNVSGGQKQRLCIARALLKKPSILILDDSTSAVDTATDKSIRDQLKTMLPGTTKIIIAQRIASVKDADVILVMDSGRIVDKGTHSELLERCSIYKEVYETQNR